MTDVTSTIQFKLNGVWTDIPDVRDRDGITARRGYGVPRQLAGDDFRKCSGFITMVKDK